MPSNRRFKATGKTDWEVQANRLTPSSPDLFLSSISPAWQKQARCRDMDPDIFFPEQTGGKNTRKARQACASCPVIDECRKFTFEWESKQGTAPVGFVAGLGSTVRRRIYQQWRREEREQDAA